MAVCPLCHQDAEDVTVTAEQWILDLIARENPTWVQSDGACPRCVELYREKGEKDAPE